MPDSPNTRQLLPEILHQIFFHLVVNRSSRHWPVEQMPCDLMAASMVCMDWWLEARRLVDERMLHSVFSHLCHPTEAKRFAMLMGESKRLGLDYWTLVVRAEIYVNELIDLNPLDRPIKDEHGATVVSNTAFDRRMEAYTTIMELCPPNLIDLTVILPGVDLAESWSVDRFCHYLEKMEPACASIRRFRLVGRDREVVHPKIVSFVASLAPNLRLISLYDFTLDSALSTALRRFTGLRGAHFSGMVTDDHLPTLLPSWPYLHYFKYDHIGQTDLGASVVSLARSCPRVKDFSLQRLGDRSMLPVPALALCHVLLQLPLTRFSVSFCNIDDTFLLALMAHGTALQHIELYKCSEIVGDTAVLGWKDGWPNLKRLLLDRCDRLSFVFVKKVIGSCVKLEQIELPAHLHKDNDCRELITQGGFQIKMQSRLWERVDVGSGAM
ncbi:hypothetical protein BC936DRAFT_147364 [Jimgerdemannia flammicorona]|uniref:Uncharacterized protein n=2 Tax=Jimgerdemannia flammicorona TaxID=994334 RepID=A0A433D5J6_9FUNG|nr:hypothetical protein BC936DRAFT_147364 [Jimgerdemannia flammicorona]RUS25135.1 hypothetical protein BC938DRAFT_472582 [Jimgerdemannia flammicorona]